MGLFRLYLAVCVFNAHAGYFIPHQVFPDATVAVRAFYVLSGFYMAMVINEKYGARTLAFYAARVVRLYPLYLIVLAAAVALQLAGQLGTVPDMWSGSRTYTTAPTGLALAGMLNDLLMFPAALLAAVFSVSLRPPFTTEMLNAPAFTLGVELIFYALAPLIVRRGIGALAALTALGLALHAAPALMGLPARPFQYEMFSGVFVFFMAGVLAYRLAPRRLPALPWLGWAVAGGGALAIYLFPLDRPTNSAGSALFYIAVAAAAPLVFRATAKSRIDAFLGDLSYPLYVVHFPLVLWAAGLGLDPAWRTAVAATAVTALTVLLTLGVERPLRLARKGALPRLPAALRRRRVAVPA